MTRAETRHWLREWVVLWAILAMLLAPLAIAVSRSLAADDKVRLASGAAAIPLCIAGVATDDLAASHGGAACDQCLPPAFAGAGKTIALPAISIRVSRTLEITERAQQDTRRADLPPATGPPAIG